MQGRRAAREDRTERVRSGSSGRRRAAVAAAGCTVAWRGAESSSGRRGVAAAGQGGAARGATAACAPARGAAAARSSRCRRFFAFLFDL